MVVTVEQHRHDVLPVIAVCCCHFEALDVPQAPPCAHSLEEPAQPIEDGTAESHTFQEIEGSSGGCLIHFCHMTYVKLT